MLQEGLAMRLKRFTHGKDCDSEFQIREQG